MLFITASRLVSLAFVLVVPIRVYSAKSTCEMIQDNTTFWDMNTMTASSARNAAIVHDSTSSAAKSSLTLAPGYGFHWGSNGGSGWHTGNNTVIFFNIAISAVQMIVRIGGYYNHPSTRGLGVQIWSWVLDDGTDVPFIDFTDAHQVSSSGQSLHLTDSSGPVAASPPFLRSAWQGRRALDIPDQSFTFDVPSTAVRVKVYSAGYQTWPYNPRYVKEIKYMIQLSQPDSSLPPSFSPSNAPSSSPSDAPTSTPSDAPTSTSSDAPTSTPSDAPTSTPSYAPTSTPSYAPTSTPSYAPASTPSCAPTNMPSYEPPSWSASSSVQPSRISQHVNSPTTMTGRQTTIVSTPRGLTAKTPPSSLTTSLGTSGTTKTVSKFPTVLVDSSYWETSGPTTTDQNITIGDSNGEYSDPKRLLTILVCVAISLMLILIVVMALNLFHRQRRTENSPRRGRKAQLTVNPVYEPGHGDIDRVNAAYASIA